MSHLGVLVALAGSIISMLSSRIARETGQQAIAGFSISLGIGLMVFGIDDLLLLHESVAPSIGIPELAVLALYPLGLGWLLLRFWLAIVDQTDFGLLLAGLALLAASGLVDLGFPLGPISSAVIEDPLKILGLAMITAYTFRTFISLSSRLPGASS